MAFKDHMEQSLVLETLEKALQKRSFAGDLIFHSDRASSVQKLLMEQGIQVSQGFHAYDNAAMESFFRSWKTRADASRKRI